MAAQDNLGPQWHTSPNIGLGDAEWLHVGTRTAAVNRAKDWDQEKQRRGDPSAQPFMHQVSIHGSVYPHKVTDLEANDPVWKDIVSRHGHQALSYTNEFEDPGSTSYLVRRSAVRMQSTSKFRGK